MTKTQEQIDRRKQYMREYQLQWTRRRRKSYMADKSCARCGSTENLELDHVDPLTKVDHRIWSWSKIRRDEELAKCQTLCHNCHQNKTAVDLLVIRPRFSHGNVARYKNGCRCDPCKQAKSVENARRDRRKK